MEDLFVGCEAQGLPRYRVQLKLRRSMHRSAEVFAGS